MTLQELITWLEDYDDTPTDYAKCDIIARAPSHTVFNVSSVWFDGFNNQVVITLSNRKEGT